MLILLLHSCLKYSLQWLWELWRSRCAARYGNELPSVRRSEISISNNLSELIKERFRKVNFKPSWEHIQMVIDQPINYRAYKMVKWKKSPDYIVKINSDRSCVGTLRCRRCHKRLHWKIHIGILYLHWTRNKQLGRKHGDANRTPTMLTTWDV